ncbi:MAG: MarR family transcriptional regulator [Gemmatimonadaceae bacterium]
MPRPRASAGQPPAVVADRLHSAAIHLLRALRRRDVASGLSAPRLSALSVVVFGGPLTLGALAAAEQVRPPTMTHLVRALEGEGLVARAADPVDGRVVHVRATAKGRDVLARGRALRVALLARALTRLSRADRTTLAGAAAIIERILPGMQ